MTLTFEEQELFDLIMLLHESRTPGETPEDLDVQRRRDLLLQKLHDAFEPLFAPPADDEEVAA